MISLYSIVIPVYNSEKIIKETVREIEEFFSKTGFLYEVILVNDGSKDNSWIKLEEIATTNNKVIAINLLKNYGQHNAVLCGFSYASGEYVITMDDDLQNPPAEIIHLINKMNEGYDAVFGKFKQKKHSFTRRMGSKFIGYLNTKIFNKPCDITLSNFRIIRMDVVKRILEYRTGFPYIPGLILMFSNQMANVLVEHRERMEGKSNYTARKILQLTARLLFNYSSFPLRVLSKFGVFLALFGFLVGLFAFIRAVFYKINIPGWASTVVLITFFNGFCILLLGIMGEYLSRIMSQLSSQNSYQIKKVIKSEK
jgi:glycosyltransferase involved in cell wall biosynthesis